MIINVSTPRDTARITIDKSFFFVDITIKEVLFCCTGSGDHEAPDQCIQ